MSPEKPPGRRPMPNQELLQEDKSSLEALRRSQGTAHALTIARKSAHDIELFIEQELRQAAAASPEMARELPLWEGKLTRVREFIAENSEDEQD